MTPAEHYQAVRDELIGALGELDATRAGQSVPACPEWTVKDVAGHLCGLNAELLGNVQGGLGSDEATSRQVGDRADNDLSAVVAEWRTHAAPLHERLVENPAIATALLADLVIHVYDLAEVLDQPTIAAAAATPVSANRYVPLLQERVAEQMDVALAIQLDGTDCPAERGTTAVTVRTDSHQFLRGVTGRLRRADVESFDWSTDPADILDQAWNQYGPFRA